MSEPQKRKLAAILFADIVGYTALMQINEQLALASLQKFKAELEAQVPTHHGKIIQFYGDGCLVTFSSSVDAVICAKNLQLAFQSKPKVPVRIGLHAGDVVFKEGNVFGDAVNIASRVESMGISGAVLLSSNVRNQIKNKPEFQLASLGKFGFKNVEEGMTVYALKNEGFPIPDSSSMNGKGKILVTKNKFNKPSYVIFASLLGLLTIFLAYQFWNRPFSNVEKKNSINNNPVEVAKKSIAVLPIKNWSGNSELEFFCDGMTDAVISRLTRISSLDKVVSRTSIFKYKDTNKSLPEIAKELGVTHLLEGSFQKSGNQLKINLQLIDGLSDNHFWSDEYTGVWNSDDIFKIQAEVAENVATNMDVEITEKEIASIQKIPTNNKEAYDLFLQAEYQRLKSNEQALNNAILLYEQAIALDANFAEAYIGLAYIWSQGGLVWGVFKEQEARERVKTLLQKALEIDSTNQYAISDLADSYFYYDWNFELAEQSYKALKKIGFAHGRSGIMVDYLIKTGRYQDALINVNKIIAVNPSDGVQYFFKAEVLMFLGKNEEAIQLLASTDPLYSDNWFYLRETAKLYFYLEEYEKSRDFLNKMMDGFTDRPPILLWLNAVYQHKDGNIKEVDKYLEELHKKYEAGSSGSPAWFIALYYCIIKEYENAFQWLQHSYDRHEVEMTWFREEPLLIPLRDDLRYKELYRKIGFS